MAIIDQISKYFESFLDFFRLESLAIDYPYIVFLILWFFLFIIIFAIAKILKLSKNRKKIHLAPLELKENKSIAPSSKIDISPQPSQVKPSETKDKISEIEIIPVPIKTIPEASSESMDIKIPNGPDTNILQPVKTNVDEEGKLLNPFEEKESVDTVNTLELKIDPIPTNQETPLPQSTNNLLKQSLPPLPNELK